MMNKHLYRIHYALLLLPALFISSFAIAQGNNSKSISLNVEGYGETAMVKNNDGYAINNPHLLVGAEYVWKNGWSIFGELEYENAVDVTQLFVQKSLIDWLDVRLGKMTVPIGMANIYDNPMNHFTVTLPSEELAVLPTECNLMGVSFLGSVKRCNYEVYALSGNDCLAVALRAENTSVNNLRIAASGYFDGKFIVSMDLEFNSHSFVARSVTTYSQQNKAIQTTVEAGYNIFQLMPKYNGSIFAFAHYEYARSFYNSHRATIGINYQPIRQIIAKMELSNSYLSNRHAMEFAIGIGVVIP